MSKATEWRGDMASVAEMCGEGAAEALAAAYPGIALYIPETWKPKCNISAVGASIGMVICAAFGGDKIYVPSLRRCREDISDDIEELLTNGFTLREVALRLGYTQSWIMQVRKRGKRTKVRNMVDPRQQRMFD